MRAKATYGTKVTTLKTGQNCRSKFPDKSTGLQKSPSVDSGATRSKTAPTPKSIGGRKTGM
jgi:hypothetical protein